MKRGKPLRASKALRRGAPLRAKKKLTAKKRPVRKTKLKPINPKRRKRLRMEQGLDGPKAEWIRSMPSCVTGRMGWDGDPMTVSHVLGTRAAGAGPEGIVPMLASENQDWDSLDEAKWLEKFGISKPLVREFAVQLEHQWRARGEAA